MIRVLYAHPIGFDDARIDADVIELELVLQRLHGPDRAVLVVAGRDDFEELAAGLGGWDAWVADVACGFDPVRPGQLRYDYLVAPWEPMGRAVHRIAQMRVQSHGGGVWWWGGRDDPTLFEPWVDG